MAVPFPAAGEGVPSERPTGLATVDWLLTPGFASASIRPDADGRPAAVLWKGRDGVHFAPAGPLTRSALRPGTRTGLRGRRAMRGRTSGSPTAAALARVQNKSPDTRGAVTAGNK